MFLPDNLRVPGTVQCQTAIFVNANIHTSIICLHRGALAMLNQFDSPGYMKQQSKFRLLPAAEEILRILKTTTKINTTLQNPIMAFSAYMAAIVFLENILSDQDGQSQANLDFLLGILKEVGLRNPVVRSMALQLAMDMERTGVNISLIEKVWPSRNDTKPLLNVIQVKDLPASSLSLPLLAQRDITSPQIIYCVAQNKPDPVRHTDNIDTALISASPDNFQPVLIPEASHLKPSLDLFMDFQSS